MGTLCMCVILILINYINEINEIFFSVFYFDMQQESRVGAAEKRIEVHS